MTNCGHDQVRLPVPRPVAFAVIEPRCPGNGEEETEMRENLATLLEVIGDVAGDRPAVIQGSTRRSWRELDQRAARLARQLADTGVKRGDRVAIALYNGPEYVETILAVMKLRCALVNVNY